MKQRESQRKARSTNCDWNFSAAEVQSVDTAYRLIGAAF
jgi:hypothetical protein